jgi:protein-L-isoaspartate(D-aspartate) O-methyltransferase
VKVRARKAYDRTRFARGERAWGGMAGVRSASRSLLSLGVAGLALASACLDRTTAPRPRDPTAERNAMVHDQMELRGIRDARVLGAFRAVPRHRFVPPEVVEHAYGDHPLPIGYEQTISQPYIVAYMTEALGLRGTERVLEIGTGSGYQAAILAKLAREVFTIEIVPELGQRARGTLESLGFSNVRVRIGDGYRGWPEEAPFDAIVLTAAPEVVPQPLFDQLAVGGRLVAPVGRGEQELVLFEKTPRGIERRELLPVRFVPMTGEALR